MIDIEEILKNVATVFGVTKLARVFVVSGIGKSCLCNRFVRQAADDFSSTQHISFLSQQDFFSPVINRSHSLYWGPVHKTCKLLSTSFGKYQFEVTATFFYQNYLNSITVRQRLLSWLRKSFFSRSLWWKVPYVFFTCPLVQVLLSIK